MTKFFGIRSKEIAEPLGVTLVGTEKNARFVTLKKNNQRIKLTLYSDDVSNSRMAYLEKTRKIFYLEQAPLVINDSIMIPQRFIAEALGADLIWDEKHTTVNIVDNGNFAQLPTGLSFSQTGGASQVDYYYKLYSILIGPAGGPNFERAKNYVLSQGLLKEVAKVERCYTSYEEYCGSETVVSGIDENNQEKIIWLTQNKYVGEISVVASVLNTGISREKVISLLQEKGITNIIRLDLVPSTYKGTFTWQVVAEMADKQCYYRVNSFTGAIYEGAYNNHPSKVEEPI